jgi:tRNA A-37 threonylcarbamoyl transferase component Bud32
MPGLVAIEVLPLSRRRDDHRDSEVSGTDVDPAPLPSPPGGVSRVDTLPEDFVALLSRRPLVAGDRLANHYKLIESLGEGGMGQVFVAENLAIGSRVAVKLLRPELLADAAFRRRFQLEAMATAAVEHRNVARFMDLVVGDPTFLVTEYVPGPSLAEVLRGGALEWKRAARLAVRLCWALEAAHRRGIVHRDVKPANVIISPDPELGEEPKLLDFGLAKVPTIVGAENLTRTGQIVGTPHYMAPEQIANRQVDARSDIYALGCLLHHMLDGAPPFAGGDDVQVLYQQINDSAPDIRKPIPAELQAVVRRALAKQPAARYASMSEMARALEEKAGPSPPARASVSPRGARLALAGAVVVLVASLGLLVSRRWMGHERSLLIVTSRPPGAAVAVDGRTLPDSTPTVVQGIGAGKHLVRVTRPGRNFAEQDVTVAAGERVAVELALPQASHPIDVETIPLAASVFIDGAQIPGETPLQVSLTDDDFHEIRVEKLGYEPTVRAMKPEDHMSRIDLKLDPEREPRGRLIVESMDTAEVFIDGRDTGFQTPTIPMRIGAGPHLVEVRDSATSRTASVKVTVRQGETLRATLSLREEGRVP